MDHLHASSRSRLVIAFLITAMTTALVLVASPPGAHAAGANRLYWGNEGGAVRSGNLDGSGVAITERAGNPCGVALDPAAGKLYSANWFGGGITVANLDGSGVTTVLYPEAGDNLCGIAVNPATGKLYWADFSTQAIRVGNANGTGVPTTLFTEPGGSAPSGVAIDVAGGKIYWTNQFSDEVRVGNLDGTGLATTVYAGEDNPIGVALANGKLYWTDLNAGQVRVGNLDGSVPPATLFGGENSPGGLSLDPGANKVYWASFFGGAVRVGNLDGTGTATTLFSGEGGTLFTALLKLPVNTVQPNISGGAKTGKEMTCQRGSWAGDLLGAFLYRAPSGFTYQWKRDGVDVATGLTYTPTIAGDYTCVVTAANQAGSTSQLSSVKKVKDK